MPEINIEMSQEPEFPIDAVAGLGSQTLELIAPTDEPALAEGSEQLVFSSPHVIDTLDPYVLTQLTVQFMPALDTEPWLRSWHLTDGRVASAHVYWKFSYDRESTIPVIQLRSEVVDGVQQAVEVRVRMVGAVDKAAEALEVALGVVGQNGAFEPFTLIGLAAAELSGLLSPKKNRAVTDLVMGLRSTLTKAEISSHVQVERQPLPRREY